MSAHRTPALLALASVICFVFATSAPAQNIVISQVYGGGGGSSGTFNRDFVELFNRSSSSQVVQNWSVQYAATTGSSWSKADIVGPFTIPAGGYLLIALGTTGSGGAALPAAEVSSTGINMSATAGKVALVNNTTLITSGTVCPVGAASVVDFVGYGSATTCSETTPTANLSATSSAVRNGGGCTDTGNNAADFTIVTSGITPRNSSTNLAACSAPTPPTGTGTANPSVVTAGSTSLLTVTVTPGGNPTSTGITVTGNLSTIGGSATQTFFDNGTNGDVTAGDNIFSFLATVAPATTSGTKTLPFSIADAQLRSGSGNITLLVGSPLAIHDIQGTTGTSPYNGQTVSTSGVVTGVKSNGFFIQSDSPDTDPNTSEGLFVFTSSAPPAWVAPGTKASVLGNVSEFRPSSTPNAQTITEIVSIPSVPGTPTVTQIPGTFPLPAPVILTSADFSPSGTPVPPADVTDPNAVFKQPLERYEFMRVQIDTLNVFSGSEGSKSPEFATGSSNGRFYGTLPGTNRPFREAGVDFFVNLPATPPPPCCVPRFDGNLEKFRIDTIGFATPYTVANNTVVTGIVGVLDFLYTPTNSYLIVPTSGPTSPATDLGSYVAVPVPNGDEFTIASMNVERFFDDVDDPALGEPVATTVQYQTRLSKLSLQLRNVVRLPDIIGFQEIENIQVLRNIRDRINADAAASNPQYEAYLFEGNDVGGIDVGFLVKTSRVQVVSVSQENKTETWVNPTGGTETLNDRPPVVLKANILGPGGAFPVTVVVVHQRSLSSADADSTEGRRVRAKRQAQAESLARLLSTLQTGSPTPRVVCVGDFNAFEMNDGYTDVMGTTRGDPVAASEVVVNVRNDFVTPDFVELLDLAPASERYSYVFDGQSQNLDHIIANQAIRPYATRLEHGRVNAGFPETLRSDATRPERVADHDPTVAYFRLPGLVITAPAAVCAYTTQTASVADPGGAASYSWSVTNGFVVGPVNDRTIFFTATGPLPVILSVVVTRNGFSQSAQTSVAINPGPIQPFINAPATLCAGASGNTASVDAQAGATYAWTITGGTIVSGAATNAITFTAGSGPSLSLGVTVTVNGCSRTETKTVAVGSTPVAPSIVNPANGTTNFTSGYLSWTSAGLVDYDVYFDTVNPPQKKVATTVSNFIATPSWFPNTTYYWFVTARSGCGSASSAVASFTTGTCPFSGTAPSLAAPANGSLGLARTLILSWSSVPGAGRYDIYIGTSASPASQYKVASTPLTSQKVSLNPGTLYFWRVVAVPACGSASAASSVTYSFTTADGSPKLSSVSPATINRWTGGSLSIFGSGFVAATTPFTDYKGSSAGTFTTTWIQDVRLDGVVAPSSLAPAGRYDVGIAEGGTEQARLLQAVAVRAFTDVTENEFYFESTARVADAGIMESDLDAATAGPQFSPSTTVIRRKMADYLSKAYQWWRTGSTALPAATCVPSGTGSTDFPDVPCSDPNWLAIHWIKVWGVTNGSPCAQGLCFLPESSVDRAQMVTFLERLRQGSLLNTLLSTVGETDPGCSQTYPACSGWTDAMLKTAGWPRREVNVAFADRLTAGCSGTPGNNLTMCASAPVTRGEMAEFLARTIGLTTTP